MLYKIRDKLLFYYSESYYFYTKLCKANNSSRSFLKFFIDIIKFNNMQFLLTSTKCLIIAMRNFNIEKDNH